MQRSRHPSSAYTGHFREIRQRIKPEFPIPAEVRRGPVRGISVHQHGNRLQGSFPRWQARQQRCVDLSLAGSNGRGTQPVYRDMVSTLIPEEPAMRHPEHSLRKKGALPQVDRATHIRPHPVLGSGTRVRRRADINDVERPVGAPIDILPQRLAISAKTEMASLGLADGALQGDLKQIHVQITMDLEILTRVVDRIIRTELLGMPDTKLPGHQFPAITFRSRHACIPQSLGSCKYPTNSGPAASGACRSLRDCRAGGYADASGHGARAGPRVAARKNESIASGSWPLNEAGLACRSHGSDLAILHGLDQALGAHVAPGLLDEVKAFLTPRLPEDHPPAIGHVGEHRP